jgi:hypothetical protein
MDACFRQLSSLGSLSASMFKALSEAYCRAKDRSRFAKSSRLRDWPQIRATGCWFLGPQAQP